MKPSMLPDGLAFANPAQPSDSVLWRIANKLWAAKKVGRNSSKAAFVTCILRLYPSGAKLFVESSILELRVGVLPIVDGAWLLFRFISDQIC
jgi:hypothetical protein